MRDRLIKLIASCNSKKVRRKWIIEMSNMNDIECSESQCDGCIIQKECLDTLMDRSDDLVNITPECIECKVQTKDMNYICRDCQSLIEYYGGN